MGTEGDYDVKRPLRDVIGTLLELVLPAEQRNLIPRLTDMVSACKGVVEHRGKLWGELSEGESNIVATRVGAIAREILGTGRSAETGEPQKKRRRRSRPLSMRGGGALAVKPTSPPSRMLVTGGVPVPAREYARSLRQPAIALLAHALNARDNPDLPYRYSDEAIEHFNRIVGELSEIFDDGEIIETLLPSDREIDRDFQAFMRKALANY